MTSPSIKQELKVRERPILFSGPMVRAILDGEKTQTRRVATKLNPAYLDAHCDAKRSREWRVNREAAAKMWSPYGQAGDRLWVRETHYVWSAGYVDGSGRHIAYRASDPDSPNTWTPAIHMPRWASRLSLEITNVRVERLQDISEADAVAEGMTYYDRGRDAQMPSAHEQFHNLWDSLNAKRGYGWDVNPWVWVIEFNRVEAST